MHSCIGESTPFQDINNKKCKKAHSGEEVGEAFGASP